VRLTRIVRRSLGATLEMALPSTCGGCGAPGPTWCCSCAHETGHTTPPGGPGLVFPTPCPVGHPPTWAATSYEGAARAALVAFKDGDRRDLAAVLAPILSHAIAAALGRDASLRAVLVSGNGPVFAVPVPSSSPAVRRRGDAPLELLTRAALHEVALSERELIVSPALGLRRRVADQAGLDRGHRATNLERAMQVQQRWRPNIRGVTCLLVDDVLTTGATLTEAARALRAAGAEHVAAATVAATRRRGIQAGGGAREPDLGTDS